MSSPVTAGRLEVAAAFVDRSHIDHEFPGRIGRVRGTPPRARRSRSPGRNCRTRRSCSQRGPPRSRRTVRRSRRERRSASWIRRVWTGAARPRASTNSPDSTRSPFQASMNACIGAKASGARPAFRWPSRPWRRRPAASHTAGSCTSRMPPFNWATLQRPTGDVGSADAFRTSSTVPAAEAMRPRWPIQPMTRCRFRVLSFDNWVEQLVREFAPQIGR